MSIRDVNAVIDSIMDTPAEANHAFVALKTLFNWCLRRGLLHTHPLVAQHKPAKTVARDRVLSAPELVAVCRAAMEGSSQFDRILLLLLLTRQRRGEIAGLEWRHIKTAERTITLPVVLTKNNRTHTFPHGEAVAGILAQLPKSENPLLFPSESDAARPFTNFSLASSTSIVGAPSRTGRCMTCGEPSLRSLRH